MEFNQLKYVLLDIEGTVSDINFVKNVMFPYSAEKLPEFSKKNPQLLEGIALPQLLRWIEKDVKHPVLKKVQGMIWKEAFENGAFKAPLYDDVLPAWKAWSAMGLTLGIYSSGSVTAQKMFFAHSTEGNLLNYLKHHFDLDIGGKKERESYERIAEKLALNPKEILFLSDVKEELLAAKAAGFQVAHIIRPGTEPSEVPGAYSFSELVLNP